MKARWPSAMRALTAPPWRAPRPLPAPRHPTTDGVPKSGTDLLRAVAHPQSGARAIAQDAILRSVGPVLEETLAAHAISPGLETAHLLAQCAHESDGFCTTEEYASGRAYEGRRDLGNTRPGDGPRFKGRGLIQLTGRANYRRYGRSIGLDLEAAPEQAAEPRLSLRLACLYWQDRGLALPARADDLETVTRGVNGGLNGLADRRRYLARAKAALGLPLDGPDADDGREAIRRLQLALKAAGHRLSADGIAGPRTRAALGAFQHNAGLARTGVADTATLAALDLSEDDRAN
ncbi:MAG: peptidoglycan-binding protein [Pseudomonadota bacterium]